MLCKQQEFLALPADKLVEIIRDDDLNVMGEETVYEACMEWLNFDLTSRFRYVAEVMKCVRFANISSYYFCDKIDHNEVYIYILYICCLHYFSGKIGHIKVSTSFTTSVIKLTILKFIHLLLLL